MGRRRVTGDSHRKSETYAKMGRLLNNLHSWPAAVGFAHLKALEACLTCDPLQWISGGFLPLAKPESKDEQAYSVVEAGCGSCVPRLR